MLTVMMQLVVCGQVGRQAPSVQASPDSIAIPVDASRDIEPLFRAVAEKKVDELIEDEAKDGRERYIIYS